MKKKKPVKKLESILIFSGVLIFCVSVAAFIIINTFKTNHPFPMVDGDTSFTLLENSANQGDPEAMFKLGYIYEHGVNIKENNKLAVEYYEGAVDKKYAPAFLNLGYLYLSGLGVQQNTQKALSLFEQAVQGGKQSEGNLNIGLIYYFGLGVTKDPQKALYYFKAAAAYNNKNANYYAGQIYLESKNYSLAYHYFYVANMLGNPEATNGLAQLYLKLTPEQIQQLQGKTLPDTNNGLSALENHNYFLALQIFNQSENQNNPIALLSLGSMYYFGLGITPNATIAAKYYTAAAKLGNLDAIANLAEMYHYGIDVPRNLTKALEYDRQIIQNSALMLQLNRRVVLAQAAYDIALIYYQQQQYQEAFNYFLISSKLGSVHAFYYLGQFYLHGLKPVSADFQTAYLYFLKAELLQDPWGMEGLGQLLANLTFPQIDELDNGTFKMTAATLALAQTIPMPTYNYKKQETTLINLAKIYMQGKEVPQNQALAKQYLHDAEKVKLRLNQKPIIYLYTDGFMSTFNPTVKRNPYASLENPYNYSVNYMQGLQGQVSGTLNAALFAFSGSGTQNSTPTVEKQYFSRLKAQDRPFFDYNLPYQLGLLYYNQKNYPEALSAFLKAEKLGSSAAGNQLGIMYLNGQGVQKNLQSAFNYFVKASMLENKAAKKNLQVIANKVTSAKLNALINGTYQQKFYLVPS